MKVFKDFIAPFGLPVLGGAIGSSLSRGLGAFGRAAGVGLGAAAGGAAGAAIQGKGNVGRNALIAGGLGTAGSLAKSAFSNFKQPSSTTVSPSTAVSRPGGGGSSPSISSGAGSSQSPGILSKMRNFFTPGGGPPGGPPSGTSFEDAMQLSHSGGELSQASMAPFSPAPAQPNKSGINMPMLGAGALTSLAGNLLPGGQAPEIPDFSGIPSVQEISSQNGQPLTDVARSATQRLQERLGQTPESNINSPAMQIIKADQEAAFKRQRDALYSQYQANNPGTDLSNNTDYQRASNELTRNEAAALANTSQQELGRFENRQTSDIATALGIDEQTLDTMMELAKLDIAQIMAETGLKAQEAQDFRSTFAQLGQILASRAVGGTGAMSPFQLQIA